MEIRELEIYPYIERDMDQISQVELKAEEYLCRAGLLCDQRADEGGRNFPGWQEDSCGLGRRR